MFEVGGQGSDDVSYDEDFRLVENIKYYEDNKNDVRMEKNGEGPI